MLYFDYNVDWHEHNLFVKAEYPIDVNAKNAVYDIQFSYIERPVHKNTLWDFARFECCGHKFADLSDNGYGLSIINDCKYGYNATRDTLKISLLKNLINPIRSLIQVPIANLKEYLFSIGLLMMASPLDVNRYLSASLKLISYVKKKKLKMGFSYMTILCTPEDMSASLLMRQSLKNNYMGRFFSPYFL